MDNKENENLVSENFEVDKLGENNPIDEKKNNTLDINNTLLLNSDTNDTPTSPSTEPIIKNKFIRFMDKHCFAITTLIGCFYIMSSAFVTISYAYATNPFTTVLYYLYVGFFFVHIIFWTGLAFYYRNIKYFGHLLLGLFIGLLTCGGFLMVIVNI